MKVSNTSIISGKVHVLDIPITDEQLLDWLEGKGLLQTIAPQLSASEREFLISGMSYEEQDQYFGKFEDEIGNDEDFPVDDLDDATIKDAFIQLERIRLKDQFIGIEERYL